MKHRIFSALKHFALSATLRRLPNRKRHSAYEAPEPRRQPLRMPILEASDALLFDKAPVNAISHRMDMLANEVDRLTGTLSGLRAFLGTVAGDAPTLAAAEVTPLAAPMISDADLFEGEPLAATPNAIPATGEAGFLFEEDAPMLLTEEHSPLLLERQAA